MERECVDLRLTRARESACVCVCVRAWVACAEHNCVLPCVKTINQVHLMLCHYG